MLLLESSDQKAIPLLPYCTHEDQRTRTKDKDMSGRNKGQRLHEEQKDDRSEVDVRLSDDLRGLLGGRKCVKAMPEKRPFHG